MPTPRDIHADTNTNTNTNTGTNPNTGTDTNTSTETNTSTDTGKRSDTYTNSEVEGLTIDCDRCALQNTAACDDCVVSFVLGREPDDAIVIDAEEARAMRMLERAGLVPTLRFSNRAG